MLAVQTPPPKKEGSYLTIGCLVFRISAYLVLGSISLLVVGSIPLFSKERFRPMVVSTYMLVVHSAQQVADFDSDFDVLFLVLLASYVVPGFIS